jgi:hypothetical protein
MGEGASGVMTKGFSYNSATNVFNVEGALIATGNVLNNAITSTVNTYTAGAFVIAATNTWYTIAQVTVTNTDASANVLITVSFGSNRGNQIAVSSFRILRNTFTLYGSTAIGDPSSSLYVANLPNVGTGVWCANAMSVIDTPGVGTFTYYAQIGCHGTDAALTGAKWRTMQATLLKR